MNASLRAFSVLCFVSSTVAGADDASACKAGDTAACARIGQLKQQGALKSDLTKDTDALVTACGKALDAASGPNSMSQVSSACSQLFTPELQKSWSALASIRMPGADMLFGTAYAEAYCPKLSGKTPGCNGKRAANFSQLKPPAVREALRTLNQRALELELGAEKAAPLVEKFNKAWDALLGAS